MCTNIHGGLELSSIAPGFIIELSLHDSAVDKRVASPSNNLQEDSEEPLRHLKGRPQSTPQ